MYTYSQPNDRTGDKGNNSEHHQNILRILLPEWKIPEHLRGISVILIYLLAKRTRWRSFKKEKENPLAFTAGPLTVSSQHSGHIPTTHSDSAAAFATPSASPLLELEPCLLLWRFSLTTFSFALFCICLLCYVSCRCMCALYL